MIRDARLIYEQYAKKRVVENSETNQEVNHDETDMSNPAESREVQIGKQILSALKELRGVTSGNCDSCDEIEKLANELIQMHGQKPDQAAL